MSLPPSFLDELRARLPITEVVGKRLTLTRAGREHKACCPFHKEKTPSFTVSDDKGFFHCFGCGAHGDVIGFVMRHDRLSFMEAIEQLAGQAGLEVPRPSPQERARHEKQKSLYELVEAACRYFEAELEGPGGRAARDYLARRGLDEQTIARFRLGWAPPGGQALLARLKGEGFGEAQILEAGLARRPEDGRSPYAFFRERIVFPVTDARGRVVAFGARLMEGDGPKYLNSPDTPIFHKGQLLYGLAHARDAVLNGAQFIVVEGYLDVIALHQNGFASAVAPLGTAMTEAQIAQLWRATPETDETMIAPIVCFDGDDAGRRAASRLVDRALPLLEPNRSVEIAFMPEGEDPDSILRGGGGAEAFSRLLTRRLSLRDYIWRTAIRGGFPDVPERQAALRKQLTDIANRIANKTIGQLYLRDFVSRWYDALRPDRQKRRDDAERQKYVRMLKETAVGIRTPERDVVLVALLVNRPEKFELFVEHLEQIHFSNDFTEIVYDWCLRIIPEDAGIDADRLQAAILEHDESLLKVLCKLRKQYEVHINRGDRPVEYELAVFHDILRSMQIAKLIYDLEKEVTLEQAGSELAPKRMQAISREIDRLLAEQTYLLHGDPVLQRQPGGPAPAFRPQPAQTVPAGTA